MHIGLPLGFARDELVRLDGFERFHVRLSRFCCILRLVTRNGVLKALASPLTLADSDPPTMLALVRLEVFDQ